MAEYLLDTDHLSYLQKHHPAVLNRLATLRAEDRVLTSVISVGELLRGVHLLPGGRRKRELLRLYLEVLRRMGEILPITPAVAEKFAETDAALLKKGNPIPVNDVWIAAVTLIHRAVLVTNDEHFRYVDELEVQNWTR